MIRLICSSAPAAPWRHGPLWLRQLIGRLLPHAFPLATLLINIAGSVFMGMFIGLLARFMPPQAG